MGFEIVNGVLKKYTEEPCVRKVVIPDGVTSIGESAFEGCSRLTNVAIPNGVISIGNWAFNGCRHLTIVTIPKGVVSIGNSAFSLCENLISITLPDSVATIGDDAFCGCKKLTSVTMPKHISNVGICIFYGCAGLSDEEGFIIKEDVLYGYSGRAKQITIPNGIISIAGGAFYKCGCLTDVTIPNSVTSIGELAFFCCKKLKNLTLPDHTIKIGDAAFRGCKGLADNSDAVIIRDVLFGYEHDNPSVTIPNGVVSISGYAFSYCLNLTNVTIPDSIKSIGKGAFKECRGLSGITIPNGVTAIGDEAFYQCKKLASITIPGNVTSIGNGSFCDCVKLATIEISEGVKNIGKDAFKGCGTLTNVVVPSSVVSIGSGAFFGCKSLKNISIPDSVMSIGNKAFGNCGSLTNITMLNSIMIIGEGAFVSCKHLADFTCPSSLAKRLPAILPKTQHTIVLHMEDITEVSTKYRPGAAVGFAEDGRDCTDENGKQYCKYIKSNAVKLVGLAAEHPALLYLMLREKLIAAKDLDAVTAAVQETGNAELIAAVLNYGNSAVSEKDKEKVRKKKDQRETNVTNFIFDAEKLEALKGKTFVVTGSLKTFVSRDELKECLTTCGAVLTETLGEDVDYLITNTPDSGTAKNKKAVELGVARITEAQFNDMIGRKAAE